MLMEPEKRTVNPPKSGNDERATVLIACLGILVALVLMGVTFTTLQRLESRGARNFLESVEANQISDAVIQYTIDRLRTGRTYTGGTSLLLGAAHMVYSPNPLDADLSPLYDFTYYDFPTGDSATTAHCDVKVLDCSGQIYVGNDDGAMGNVQSVLQALMTYINSNLSPEIALVPTNDAAAIVAAMGNYGFNTKVEIQSALTPSGASGEEDRREKFQAIKDYITVHGVADEAQVWPLPATGDPQPRMALNINTVSGPVLSSVLSVMLTDDQTVGSTTAEEALAGIIINNRPFRGWQALPTSAWQGFVDLLEDSSITTIMQSYYTGGATAWQSDRDQVVANFLPNASLSTQNPNAIARASIGKDNLADARRTTEFCLKSAGLYEIQVGASIYGPSPDNALFSRRRCEAIVQTHQLWKHSTQQDFEGAGGAAADPEGSISTYPENSSVDLSITDGHVALAPLDLPSTAYASSSFSYGNFATSVDLSYTTDPGSIVSATDPDAAIGVDVSLTDSRAANFPGELCLDGLYFGPYDPDGSPGSGDELTEGVFYHYADQDNYAMSSSGTMTFWFKPSFTMGTADPTLFYVPFQDTQSAAGVSYNGDNLDNNNSDADDTLATDADENTEYLRYLWLYIDGNNVSAECRGCVEVVGAYTGDGYNNDGVGVGDDPGEIEPRSPLVATVPSVNWQPGEWHYIGLIWDATVSSLQLYVDGVMDDATDIPLLLGNLRDESSRADRGRLGVDPFSSDALEVGTFDELRIWYGESRAPQALDPGAARHFNAEDADYDSAPYMAGTATIPYPGRIGTVSWTGYLPDDGGTANIQVAVLLDRNGDGSFEAQGSTLDDPAGGAAFADPADSIVTQQSPTDPGYNLRYRVTFTPADPPDGSNYPNSGYPAAGFVQSVDTPILDDITITLLPAAKVIYLRELYDE